MNLNEIVTSTHLSKTVDEDRLGRKRGNKERKKERKIKIRKERV
jgi:hypothetical protein